MFFCKRIFLIGLFALSGTSSYADDAVLRHGNTAVTITDLRMAIQQTIPEHQLGYFYANRKKISELAGNFFVVRKLAEEAEARQLTQEEAWRVEETRVRALSQVQLDYLVASAPQPDFEQMAREVYLAYPDRYKAGEAVHAAHILISTQDRTDAEALERAQQVVALLAKDGADFAALALEYSDDPSAAENQGDLGFFGRNQMVKPFEEAVFALGTSGETTGPVKSDFGYHVIRLIEKRPAGLRSFDEVKGAIIAAEKASFRTRIVNEEIARLGSLEGVETNYELLMTLHKPLPVMNRERNPAN